MSTPPIAATLRDCPPSRHSSAIVAAMPQELQALLQALDDVRVERHAGRDFHLGHLHGHAVVLVLSRIGKVAAAITATMLIER